MFTLLQRLNLVYFRCTALSSNSILLPLILARSKKRQYPVYEATRTTNVFISRDALIWYEEALRVEDELDKVSDHGFLNRFERAEKVLEIFQTIYSKWKDLLANGKEWREQRLQNHPGLERFEEGTLVLFFLP
jgi:fanconi-associated nuclease 1